MKDKLRGASSDAVLLMVIKLVTMALGFAVTRLLSQYLSVYDYGTYSQILLIVSTVANLTILGMMDGVNYFYCSEQDAEQREKYLATIFTLQCAVSAVAGAMVLCLSGPLCAYFDNPGVSRLMIFAALLPLLQNLLSMIQILLVSVGKARMLAVRNLVVSLVRFGVVLLVVFAVRSVAVILMTTLLLDVVQIGIFVWILRKSRCAIRLKKTDFRLVRRILSYCLPMAIFVAINSLNRDCDKYLIALWTDTETLAVYTNASKALPFDIVMTSFCTVLLPEITRLVSSRENERAVELYRLLLEIACISTTVFCCAALAAAPQLMELLYSEKYLSGLTVFMIYVLVDMIRFTNITLVLSAAGRTKKLMLLGIGALAFNFALNVLLYRLMGVAGPAAATLLTTFGLGVLILRAGARELQTKISGFFDGKYLLIFLTESLVLTLVLYRVQTWLAARGLHYFAVLVLVAGLYGGVMLLLHGKRLLRDLKRVNSMSGHGK